MRKSFIIIDYFRKINEDLVDFHSFEECICLGFCQNYNDALHLIITKKPQLVFFYFSKEIPLTLIWEVKQYQEIIPYFIAINSEVKYAYEAIKHEVSDFLIHPFDALELKKSVLKFLKSSHQEEQNKLCVRSNGDYHFLDFEQIVYMKSDNNTTDFYIKNNSTVHGFKTLKYYESQMPNYFFRIHHSFIVNINFIIRINIGKSICYLLDNNLKIPFSRTYRNQIDDIIKQIK